MEDYPECIENGWVGRTQARGLADASNGLGAKSAEALREPQQLPGLAVFAAALYQLPGEPKAFGVIAERERALPALELRPGRCVRIARGYHAGFIRVADGRW